MNNFDFNENLYLKTSELALVSLLRLFDYKIERTERNGRQVFFFIKKDDELEKTVSDFWGHRLSVEPLDFFNSIKETKCLIYQNN